MTVNKPKIHAFELTDAELARALFVMRNVNGKDYGRALSSVAMEKLGAKDIGFHALHTKAIELARRANIPTFINYYDIQKEWESFRGIVSMDKDTMDKITKLENELAVLKGML